MKPLEAFDDESINPCNGEVSHLFARMSDQEMEFINELREVGKAVIEDSEMGWVPVDVKLLIFRILRDMTSVPSDWTKSHGTIWL